MNTTTTAADARVRVAGFDLDGLTEQQVVEHVMDALDRGDGGWIVTLNVDICQAIRRDPSLASLASDATLSVPDGMPLVWAARLSGQPLAERVTGASLILSLSEGAARRAKSVYLLGGAAGVPELAGQALAHRYPGLVVAGIDSPPLGFDTTPDGVDEIRLKLIDAAPDIVFVGMGFPKQELLITALAPAMPQTWFVACGAAIPMAAGALPRAPKWMQKVGAEWLFRLISEPRRLFGRYVKRDLPFASVLLVTALFSRNKAERRQL